MCLCLIGEKTVLVITSKEIYYIKYCNFSFRLYNLKIDINSSKQPQYLYMFAYIAALQLRTRTHILHNLKLNG